ncbi:hypothetical protein [Desulfotignum balticum]|uniref:hypothetical protein n=1 Tax=Desulfotignum balticum TaxID=115781 RepID=UPI00046267A1|nr:hypothetical protein [Desulfotignum balticum]
MLWLHFYNGHETVLTEEEKSLLTHTILFKNIAKDYKKTGLTHWGGMAWFCSEMVLRGIIKIKQGESIKRNIYEITNKLAYNCTVISVIAENLSITERDKGAIVSAHDTAMQWIEVTNVSKDS